MMWVWARSEGILDEILKGVSRAATSERGLFVMVIVAGLTALLLLRPK
jgi:hypothetical protein